MGPTPKYLPTEAEIAAACREIQDTWDAREFERRRRTVPARDVRGYFRLVLLPPAEPWTAPEVAAPSD